ncbi:aldo/keto reductase [Arthrobacter agilis]|jgi:2,5-diketo-D-gluconate reductase A|uniref:aldo/keto reductase n=1 Tax=Arthrobacter agilis TaxID=37921 RepID=UPI00278A9BB8|nr:aldo/keto reductase [Arthrobacter agilis]MDQ0736316.1 2,5-diketo-D-gluconate reductase A [Arthrobacter agilis]
MAPAPTVQLRSGAHLPLLGLGTWPLDDAAAADTVSLAIETGYRLIDTAENYRNEKGVGEGIRRSGIPREELFVTTKFNREHHSRDGVRRAFEASTQLLGLEYIDLLLVHWPNPDQGRHVEAVQGIAALLEEGLVRAVGTSNYKPAHLQQVIDAGIVPDVNQIQLDPQRPRIEERAFHNDHGIVTESWSPLGQGGGLLDEPGLVAIAAAHGRTPAQVVLRWHVQQGLVAIPKSSDPQRLAENLAVFDFELSGEELARLYRLDTGEAEIVDSDAFGH